MKAKIAILTWVLASVVSSNVSAIIMPPPAVDVQNTANQKVAVVSVLKHYGVIVHATYEDTLMQAKAMQVAINTFLAKPSTENLAAARKTWLAAREIYGQTEAFRFYGGPIDDQRGLEGQINAWPMDESFVDGVKDKSDSGLINNNKFVINKKNLLAQNARGGEENIATGWHAIEFLLWGQDLSETGPGDRSFEDFVDGKGKNAARRRLYLQVVTNILVEDLTSLTNAWAPNNNNYRAKFEKGGMESIRKILVGLGSLSRGELAGERMEVALASQNQEDEQSCFSDNTHRDIVTDAQGIQNVWLGQYKRLNGQVLSGASISTLVSAKDKNVADKLTAQIEESLALANKIQAPFDREIVGGKDAPGRMRIQATINSLIAQSKLMVESATALGITKLNLSEKKAK